MDQCSPSLFVFEGAGAPTLNDRALFEHLGRLYLAQGDLGSAVLSQHIPLLPEPPQPFMFQPSPLRVSYHCRCCLNYFN